MESSVYSLLLGVAVASPESPAILAVDRGPLVYRALVRQIEVVAETLRSVGIERTDRVAMLIPNGPEAAVCCLGVASAAISAPLNPDYSPAELEYHFQDLAPKLLIVHAEISSSATAVARAMSIAVMEMVPCPDRAAGIFQLRCTMEHKGQPELNFSRPDDVALLLHTTGSTSRPKLVPMTHRSLCSSAVNNRDCLLLAPADRCLNVMPLFHVHGLAFAVLSSLSAGASVVCPPGFHAPRFFDWFTQFDATWYTAAPTIHRAIVGRAAKNREAIRDSRLRFVRSGASALPLPLLRELEQTFHVPVIEAYAMSETGLIAINRLSSPHRKSGSVGLQIGCEVSLRDQDGNPVPCGQIGQIAVRGPNVTGGYLNSPEANAQSFKNGWFYTGDLGMQDSDGYLFITGRMSEIINRGGEKFSPQEVDEALMLHPKVQHALAFPMVDESLGEDVAAAVVLCESSNTELEASIEEELQEFLAKRLASFKVPRRIVVVKDIPKGPTGKPQRKGLAEKLGISPVPRARPTSPPMFTAPVTETQERLAEIWRSTLNIDAAGIHDDFFFYGGDSAIAAELASRIREEFGVTLELFRIFRAPTIAELSARIESALAIKSSRHSPIGTVRRPRKIPLSYAQQRLWFLSQIDRASQAYNIPLGIRLKGPLDRASLGRALDEIVARHDVLRTTFVALDSEPVQQINSRQHSRFHLIDHDVTRSENVQKDTDDLISRELMTSFDLQKGPLIRGRIIRQSDDEHILLITMHHIISDGWSLGILLKELGIIYQSFRGNETKPLPELEIQYADYAIWERQSQNEVLQREAEYWKMTLAGAPALIELPTDHPRQLEQDYAGGSIEISLDVMLTAELKRLSRQQGATLYMTLLAAWAAVLSRLSKQQDLVIGTVAANRTRSEIAEVIGFFVNTLPLRIDLSGSPRLSELMQRVKAQVLAAQEHQNISFDQIVEILQPARSLSHNPLFQVMFAWQDSPEPRLLIPGIEATALPLTNTASRFDLRLSLQPAGHTIVGTLQYATSLYERASTERFVAYLQTMLASMLTDGDQVVECLPMLPETERQQILLEWNRTEMEYESELCMQQLFERQAERTPEVFAVVDARQHVSYRELNQRANQLAHYLVSVGAGPESRIGICLERSVEMIVALLAVLKSGAAYVPLDPKAPAERLLWMIEDAEARIVITTQNSSLSPWRASLTDSSAVVVPDAPVLFVDVDTIADRLSAAEETIAPPSRTCPANLAYVLYTSGSTGKPKAVAVEHRQLCNYTHAILQRLQINTPMSFLLVQPLTVDSSVTTIFPPLCTGGSLVIPSSENALDAAALLRLGEQYRIDFLKIAPSHLKALHEASRHRPLMPGQRLVIGGEASDAKWAADLRAIASSSCQIFNHYGPTETTVGVLAYEIVGTEAEKHSTTPLGSPLGNTRIYVLDNDGTVTPVLVPGEIYVGGENLARGYLNRPDLTAERFVPDPFSGTPGARLYRTGDMARRSHNGTILFLGRNDDQVKMRGFRIELGEIEGAIQRHVAVRQSVVLPHEDKGGEKWLAAYVVANPMSGLNPAELRKFLLKYLPDYMIPRVFVLLQDMPRTPHGKIDRKALPLVKAHPELNPEKAERVAPRTPLEELIAEIWAELLRVPRIGVHDDFFELGGHSLLAIQVLSRIRQIVSINVPLQVLFGTPTIEHLASAILAREPAPGHTEKIAQIYKHLQQMDTNSK